jgi:hypothetical protein
VLACPAPGNGSGRATPRTARHQVFAEVPRVRDGFSGPEAVRPACYGTVDTALTDSPYGGIILGLSHAGG